MWKPTIGAVALFACALATATPAWAAPPANDDFANATPLGNAPLTVSGSTEDATREQGEPPYGNQSVWYAWHAATSGQEKGGLLSWNRAGVQEWSAHAWGCEPGP